MQTSLSSLIDHTLLRPDATAEEIRQLCQETITYQFASACVYPCWVSYAREQLVDATLCSVVGFPLGMSMSETKSIETSQLVRLGVDEIDMVIHIGALKSKNYSLVKSDIECVVKAAEHAIVKVIIETCMLTNEEKQLASLLAVEAGAQFIKTSTGFSKAGATVADIALIRKVVGPEIGIKASAGIRDYATVMAMVEAGATRIGTSAGVAIVEQEPKPYKKTLQ
ncbi:MAG: deoxyribose-phosphate aldolase [Simkania sp.]|nr:deoxyribose-phosphate aldolase [Simkania sp.]